jgi:hypothetical protein
MELSVASLLKTYSKGPLKGKPRIIRFAEKYKAGEEFELANGSKTKLHFAEETYKLLVSASKYPTKFQKELQKATFAAAKGKEYYKITNFKKTIEFEGKPDALPAGIQQEQKTVERINIMLSNIMKKYNYKDGVPIVLHGKVVGNAMKCGKVAGVPKSDLVLFDKGGREIVWISYKDLKKNKNGTSLAPEKSFQQWGGMSSDVMQAFPQVQDFIRRLKVRYPKGMTSGDNVAMKIKGPKSEIIKKKAIYGDDYAPGAPCGRNNVSFVVQGRLDLKEVSKGYTITSTNAGAHENGDAIRSSMDPIFYARYTGESRGFIPNCRATIYPYNGANPKEWFN